MNFHSVRYAHRHSPLHTLGEVAKPAEEGRAGRNSTLPRICDFEKEALTTKDR